MNRPNPVSARHATYNRLQSALLVTVLLGLCALAGYLLFGGTGIWVALGAGALALILEPAAAGRLTLALYGARPLAPEQAPQLWQMLTTLARRAQLPATPALY